HDYCVAKEAAAGDRAAGAKAQRSGVRIPSREHAGERNLGNVRRAGEGKQPRGGVERIFVRTSGECSRGTAARRSLAGKQGHGNDPVENPAPATQHDVVLASEVVGKAGTRVKFSFRTVEHVLRKGFKLVAQAVIQVQVAPGLPGVLKIESAVIVRGFALRLVAHGAGNSLPLEYRGIKGWFGEVGGLEAFKEENLRRSGLQAERALRGKQASEIGLKRVEQGK